MFVVLIGVAVALAVLVAFRVERWRRTPAELRGDWWPGFEEEFRAYASRLERPRRRRSDHGPVGQ